MVQIDNPESKAKVGLIPEISPQAPGDGPKAKDLYQNVQVLGDLSVGQFTRLMASMTEWVAPEAGCNYCHVAGNFASDDIYTKIVSRRMVQMTRHINAEYTTHVGETGVTCYTCHGGNNVPVNVWTLDPPRLSAQGGAGWNAGQNQAGHKANGYTSLPADPFRKYLLESKEDLGGIRIASQNALPNGSNPKNIKDTEHTYALMMHLSGALGVNCTYCHNSRAFSSWEESTPARTTAWYGLGMVQNLNENYLSPLASELPENRLGVSGDGPKVNCASCHQGINKPLGGAQMAKFYPGLKGKQNGG